MVVLTSSQWSNSYLSFFMKGSTSDNNASSSTSVMKSGIIRISLRRPFLIVLISWSSVSQRLQTVKSTFSGTCRWELKESKNNKKIEDIVIRLVKMLKMHGYVVCILFSKRCTFFLNCKLMI